MLDHEFFNLFEGTLETAFTVTGQCEICSWNTAATVWLLRGGSPPQELSESPVRAQCLRHADLVQQLQHPGLR
jgi:hypothetical protein